METHKNNPIFIAALNSKTPSSTDGEGLAIKGLNGSLKFLLENEAHRIFACERKSIFCQVS